MGLNESDLDLLREAARRHISLPPLEEQMPRSEIVVTYLGEREEPLEAPMRESVARILADRAKQQIGEEEVSLAYLDVDYSDEAECEGGNAFVSGRRCYRLIIRVG